MNDEFKLKPLGNFRGWAEFGENRKYRYSLWRVWDQEGKRVAFVGLNPSTADEVDDDPTVRRCIGFAKRWGYGGMWMLNIFAFRATDPKEMKKASDPIGHANDKFLFNICGRADLIVLAWGTHGAHIGRGTKVVKMLCRRGLKLHAFGTTKAGHPKHPLYLPNSLEPERFL